MTRDAVTVLVTADGRPANKRFVRQPDGSVSKEKAREGGRFHGRTILLKNGLATLAEAYREYGQRPDAVFSFGLFKDAPETFNVLPMGAIAKILGVEPSDRDAIAGWHEINGVPTCARMKENLLHSTVIMFDRDMVPGTPGEMLEWSIKDWIEALGVPFPGLPDAGKLIVPSSSNRVLDHGQPVGSLSCHVMVMVDDPDLIAAKWEQAAMRCLLASHAARPWEEPVPLAFGKPIKDRATGAITHHVWWPCFDKSVVGHERLVFDGAPEVMGDGLEVLPPDVQLIAGPRLDLALVKDLTQAEIRAIDAAKSQIRGVRVVTRVERRGPAGPGGKPQISRVEERVADLILALEVATPNGTTTVDALHKSGAKHVRLQSPYRESDSWAAFMGRHRDGSPFIFDMGTGVKHVLATDDLDRSWAIIRDWLRERYEPRYACKDGALFCEELGRVTLASVAPDPEIIERLVMASDAPRDKEGVVSWTRLPACFAAWIKVAWGALRNELPREGDEDAISDTSTSELEVALTNLLTSMHGHDPGTGYATYAIGAWAASYAEKHPGEWVQFEGYHIWAKAGQPLHMALRPSLASQLKIKSPIGDMKPRDLTQACKRSGILADSTENRVWDGSESLQTRVTVLDRAFVETLDLSWVRQRGQEKTEHFSRVYAQVSGSDPISFAEKLRKRGK